MNKRLAFRQSLKTATRQCLPAGVLSRASLAIFVVLGAAACSTTPQQPASQLIAADAVFARPDGSVRLDTRDPQVASLWAASEKARAENRPEIALELLYEAMEIAPQNALLWSRAAEIKLDSIEASMAEEFAVRSNSLAADNRPLLHRNWLIIEHARSMRGDLLGERSAHKQVQVYQSR